MKVMAVKDAVRQNDYNFDSERSEGLSLSSPINAGNCIRILEEFDSTLMPAPKYNLERFSHKVSSLVNVPARLCQSMCDGGASLNP